MILPIVMLVILFSVCIQLEGATLGLEYYLTPDFSVLLRPDVATAAAETLWIASLNFESMIPDGTVSALFEIPLNFPQHLKHSEATEHPPPRTEVWGIAAGQIIFSLSPGMGTAISLSSPRRGLRYSRARHRLQ